MSQFLYVPVTANARSLAGSALPNSPQVAEDDHRVKVHGAAHSLRARSAGRRLSSFLHLHPGQSYKASPAL